MAVWGSQKQRRDCRLEGSMSNPDDAYRAAPDLVPGLLEAAKIAIEHMKKYDAEADAATSAEDCIYAEGRSREAVALASHFRARAEELKEKNDG